MDEVRRTKVLLWLTVLLLLLAFMFMVTAICTPYWYKNFPVLDEPDAYGHFGLLERCGGTVNENECYKRAGVLKFHDTSWPYNPLKSKDFDVILLLLILSMITWFLAVVVSLLIYCRYCNEAMWRRYLLLLLSFLSGLLSMCGTSYFENRDKHSTAELGGRYEHGWSSYLAWVAVFTLLLVNAPVLYLCYLCYLQTDMGRTHHYNNNYQPSAPPVENHYEVIYEKRNMVDVD